MQLALGSSYRFIFCNLYDMLYLLSYPKCKFSNDTFILHQCLGQLHAIWFAINIPETL